MTGQELLQHDWWGPLTEEDRRGGWDQIDVNLVASRLAKAILDFTGFRFEGTLETGYAGSALYEAIISGAIENALINSKSVLP